MKTERKRAKLTALKRIELPEKRNPKYREKINGKTTKNLK